MKLVLSLVDDGDSCRSDCGQDMTLCGNDVVDQGEQCDDGSIQNSDSEQDACRTDCRNAHCGDGVVDTNEECDDGGIVDGDNCSSLCVREYYWHTIVIDGVNDFAPGEAFDTSTTGNQAFITYDDDNLYVGITNPSIVNQYPDQWLLIYLGGSPGSTTGYTYNTQTADLPFSAGYHFRWKADGTFQELVSFDGASWSSLLWNGAVIQSMSYVELSIPWTDVGSPPR
jgi:cysteine-rich repeat protein